MTSFLIFIFVISLILIAWMFWRDRKYLKKPTKEALGKELKKEIDKEREIFQKHQDRFDQALSRAKMKRKKVSSTSLISRGKPIK